MNKYIIDLGAHMGEDSDFYLRKGFKVIAIDASENLCNLISEKFKNHPNVNDFRIINCAITEMDNQVITFYQNENTVWGTIYESWNSRNKRLGTASVLKKVATKRLDSIIKNEIGENETIHYIKIDIEGADIEALKSLSNLKNKPSYISIESEKLEWNKLLEEFKVFKDLGYNKFKVIDQSTIEQQMLPNPPKEGDYIDFKFTFGSSGLFGNELPGEWINEEEALNQYKKIFRKYKYFGDYGYFKFLLTNKYTNKLMNVLGIYPHVGWYDTHASL